MEGLYFEVKPRKQPDKSHNGGRSPAHRTLLKVQDRPQEEEEVEFQYALLLVGSLPVHPLTTMAMLPWVVAEIRRRGGRVLLGGRTPTPAPPAPPALPAPCNEPVHLLVSARSVRCILDARPGRPWDPLHHTLLFQHRPHRVHKLLHNSQDPSYFGCLTREEARGETRCTCYLFRCQDHRKVPEIISTLRQAGKTSARQEEAPGPRPPDGGAPEDDAAAAAAFAKKFEVLFCGRVCVAQRNAPPALIDECVLKFRHAGGGGLAGASASAVTQLKRALFPQPSANGAQDTAGDAGAGVGAGAGAGGLKTVFFRRDPSFPSLQALDENGVSPELHKQGSSAVQPTSIQENRTMLFTVGKSQIFLVSPDTKKVAMEKSFREISFCSQGIRHVDHFGFICRESLENNCQFVCYVFQCTDGTLVDEIMMTLKQAFSVAALQRNCRTQGQQCESCPMLQLHRLCEKIEGLHPSQAKLELQRSVASLDSAEQASIFESTMKARPRTEQEENELVMSSLRSLYEEKQNNHQHSRNGDLTQAAQSVAGEAPSEGHMTGSRLRLEQLKTRAKRSLTESLEGIWKGSSRHRAQRENSEDSSSSDSSSAREPPLEESLSSLLQPSSPLKAHCSTGDLKQLDTSLHDPQRPALRRRANTFSHLPSPSSADPSAPPLLQDPTAASKPKLVRHYSVSTDTPHQSNPLSSAPLGTLRARLRSSSSVPSFLRFLPVVSESSSGTSQPGSDVAALSSPSVMGVVGEDSPLPSHRQSWRQQIFLRVATPQKTCDTPPRYDDRGGSSGEVTGPGGGPNDGSLRRLAEERRKRSGAELRELWRKAILQQILLLRMERENLKLQASESDLQNKRLKLDYEEITPCLKDVTLVWEKMLGTAGRAKVRFDREAIHAAVGQGVPRQHRGEIWKFLSEQYLLSQRVPSRPPGNHTPYKELLKQLTSHQHAILIDLGRTFPTHPYFSAQLGPGQLSLYNLLKAYSLLDTEVGYCQGLSFIAGVLLLHMGEEDAFHMLKFLMFDMGLRKQYRPDMIILQIQMYQLSRLLHDYHRELYVHLEQQEIGPSLYAAPWFLTAFASHFPLGFVARVFDMLFLQGSEVIFKVALSLLGSHKPLILQHEHLEAIVDFIKTTLPNLGLVQMEKTINQVFEMDLSKQLQAYEVEYHVLQEELLDAPCTLSQQQRYAHLEKASSSLRQQNMDLLEELQVAHAKIHSLEESVEGLQGSEGRLQQEVQSLQQERAWLLDTVASLRAQLPQTPSPHTGPPTGPLTHQDQRSPH
ncbi:TBC1 domain family member 1 isoform X2 [Anguilla rostrata]|uniref:TBC1 domain family member 1 isoform X2 n=1 Tax=Anguilla rostrata TaxID=7938 RepID=UPI0030D21A34